MRKIFAAIALLASAAALAQAPAEPPPGPGAPPPYAPPPPGAYPPPPPPYYPPPPPGYYRPPGTRDVWYIGFGLGSGGGRFTLDDGTHYRFSEGLRDVVAVSLNFKVGATLSPSVLLGFDLTTLRTEGSGFDFFGNYGTYGVQVTNYDAMLTWFPVQRGPFLRAGLGLATISEDFIDGTSHSRGGVGAVVGGGYAFWLGRSFNLTLNLDLSAQSYGRATNEPKSSSFANLWVGFDWY